MNSDVQERKTMNAFGWPILNRLVDIVSYIVYIAVSIASESFVWWGTNRDAWKVLPIHPDWNTHLVSLRFDFILVVSD